MSRTIRYRDIADDLRTRLDSDEFGPGDLLPSEAELSTAYSVSRVTIRKALELVRDEGLVSSRQGFGWFRSTDPVLQTLTRLSTIEEQVADFGLDTQRKVLSFAFIDATPDIEAILGCDQVLEVSRCNLIEGQPFARVTVWCPSELASELSRADVERSPFVELLNVEFGGATQTIGADAASEQDAELLRVPVGSPVLTARRVTRSADGSAVLVAEHIFAAHRTEFVVDLPHDRASWTPAGVRLVQ